MLKEVIWAQSEIMELRGDPTGLAEGYIIESTQDIHRGKLATVLVQRGTLKRGDFIVSGQCWCRVKTLDDPSVANLSAASVSQAVQIMGWKDLPGPGDEVLQVESEHAAKALVEIRHKKAVVQKQKFDLEEIKKVICDF
jgi:translation initiation factor IF-2